MKLAILHERLNPVLLEAVARLRADGVVVDLLGPEEVAGVELTALRPAHDLYYLKTSAEPMLSYAGALHEAGAATLNPYPAVARWSDKLMATVALSHAGVRVPRTWLGPSMAELERLLEEGPLVLKPQRGSRGRGVQVVRHRAELAALGVSGLAQRFHESDDGRDHKLYCIGDQVFGVRRAWRVYDGWEEKRLASEAFSPSPELCELARRCGAALGLRLYGLDVVMSGGVPFVVDVNKCAGFVGVPDAPRLLADFLGSALGVATRRQLQSGPSGEEPSDKRC
ncbi:MAG: ATP-grasp domain-containing protein [Polyangiaceae bacterium]